MGGGNSCGQLGDGTTEARFVPIKIKDIENVHNIAAGDGFSVAVLSDGTVLEWGDGITTSSSTPQEVPSVNDVLSVSIGDGFCLTLKSDGTVWTWGNNRQGQLGDASNRFRQFPAQIQGVLGAEYVAAGTAYSLVLIK